MSRSTFRVLFYLKCNAPKKNGLVPVMCRITVTGAAFLRINAKKQELAILHLSQTDRLADLPAIRQAHMRAIQPYCPQA